MQITAPVKPERESILSTEALGSAKLHLRLEACRRQELLKVCARQARIDAGEMPDFLPEAKGCPARRLEDRPLPADPQRAASKSPARSKPR